MKVFALPSGPGKSAIFFDMDCTLYTHEEYAKTQIDLPVARLAQLKGKSFEQMNIEVAGYRKDWAAAHGGKSISLGNALLAFGVSIEETIKWREELYQPEKYLAEDKQLRSVLEELSSRFVLAVVTNNPVSVAVRTFSVLGVSDILQKIVGLDTIGVSKPNKAHYLTAAHLCGVPAGQCISVGDRYDIDIALPLELGMGGILVDGVEDVYRLPELLADSKQRPL
jgi:phosphoglycolate phosphatase/putative hydrolase of the HAD superfamily